MDIDFSKLNLQYLIQARDLARQVPACAGALMELPAPVVEQLAHLEPDDLSRFVDVRVPLLAPRWDPWWWERLLQALRRGDAAQVDVVLAHAGLLTAR